MSILIEDTARNTLGGWTCDAVKERIVDGAVLSPFATSSENLAHKPSGLRIAEQIRSGGGQIWFDSGTYALGVPGVGDFRHYEKWELWGSAHGELRTPAEIEDHVKRVLKIQTELDATPLAPTILLSGPSTSDVATSVALASACLDVEPSSFLTVAGTPDFWRSGADLDAFIGSIAQLEAKGYFLIVVRPVADLPPAVSSEEISGLCRTVRSLSAFGAVHVSFGDFAGLPAIAAGATSLGTGWDSRQRVCSYTSYAVREPSGGFGSWLKRPTFEGLLTSISRAEAERLFSQDPRLASSLYVGALDPDGAKEAFFHHARCLRNLISRVATAGSHKDRFEALCSIYGEASASWPLAIAAGSVAPLTATAVRPLYDGLLAYGRDEGWEL
jgi:hypothetical protein